MPVPTIPTIPTLGHRRSGVSSSAAAAAPTYVEEVTADSPIEWWRLGESSGTSAASVGSGAHAGTYAGTFTLGAAGALASDADKATTLDGTSGRVLVPGTVATLSGSALTFECWLKTSDATKSDQLVYAAFENGNSFAGWGIYYNLSGSRKIGYYSSTAGTWVESTGTITNTAYHHVAVTVSAGGAVVHYIDGAAVGSGSSAAPGSHSGTKMIGGPQDAIGPTFFKGTLDEVAVYSTVLSAARVLAHRTAGVT